MKRIVLFSLLIGLFGGCSKQGGGLSLSGTAGSGDLVALVMNCATNRGGRVPTNVLASVQASWTHQSRDAEDIIVVTGDHFAEVRKALEQAYGAPDPRLGSMGVAGGALTYSPQQCGVVLNLTDASGQTVVCVMGWKR
jgi:hypothetical protein